MEAIAVFNQQIRSGQRAETTVVNYKKGDLPFLNNVTVQPVLGTHFIARLKDQGSDMTSQIVTLMRSSSRLRDLVDDMRTWTADSPTSPRLVSVSSSAAHVAVVPPALDGVDVNEDDDVNPERRKRFAMDLHDLDLEQRVDLAKPDDIGVDVDVDPERRKRFAVDVDVDGNVDADIDASSTSSLTSWPSEP